jgi:predicted TPR repeat methyltransferase
MSPPAGRTKPIPGLPEKIAEFRRALEREPNSDDAAFGLASAWLEAGVPDQALGILRRLSSGKGRYRKRAAEKLRDAEHMKSRSRFPEAYVRHLFDQFSATYDQTMVHDLDYRAPQILRSLADMLMIGFDGPLTILDLGCGTGLGGEAFKSVARRLDGVDLSPLMIERAKGKGIYSELVAEDLEAFLENSRRQYDLLVAADAVVYFGDLSRLLSAVYANLKPNGNFLFTTEKQAEPGFSLGPKRRYRHSGEYLRATAESAGLSLIGMLDCLPRNDAGEPVEGLAVALRRV